jgi:hypothetical protein
VLEFGLTVLFDGFVVVVCRISKRIKIWDRIKRTRKTETAITIAK